MRYIGLKCLLALSIVSLPQLSAHARLGQFYSIKTFQPYFKRGYNTLLGWKGYPVSVSDPHLYLYKKKTALPRVQIEFIRQNNMIHTEVIKIYEKYDELGFALIQELNWFLLESTEGQITLKQLKAQYQKGCSKWRNGPYTIRFFGDDEMTLFEIEHSRQGSKTRDKVICLPD